MATEDGEDGRGGLVVDTLVQGIYDDDARNIGGGQRVDDQILELRYERTLCHGRVLPDDLNNVAPKCRVPASELVCERGEYVFQFLSVEVISGAEEAGAEGSGLGDHFGERLSDGRLSCSRQPIEPEDVSVLRISGPLHDLFEDGLSSPAEAGVMMTTFISCVVHGVQLSKQLEL